MPELIAFDLDDTLAPSKSPLEPRMAALFAELLDHVDVAVVSGGQIAQFRQQVVDRLPALSPVKLARLHLLPTCGAQYFRFEDGELVRVYADELSDDEKQRAIASVELRARELGYWEAETWGPVIEDRLSQITFSALGQEAPVDAKRAWDPTGEKKNALRAAVQADVPDLEVRSGGSTSVDITRKGIDKAFAMERLVEETGLGIETMLFVGDRLDPDGNDFPVVRTGVATHAVDGWESTAAYLEEWLANR